MAVRNDFSSGEVLTAADLNDTFASKLDLAGGKILQIVRATDTTERSTTSTSFVDVTGMSVTITPQQSDSTILVLVNVSVRASSTANQAIDLAITDSSNNALSGSETARFGIPGTSNATTQIQMIGFSTPATTSATTYKLRFLTPLGTVLVRNNLNTGQIYAIEVSA